VVVTGGRRCGESSYWVVLLRGRSLVTSQSVLMEHGRAAVEIVLAERKRESLSRGRTRYCCLVLRVWERKLLRVVEAGC
ncbi:hypothetical protein H0E87_007543, partial [Populus deltoides]